MRFMVLVKATADSEAGVMPTPEELTAMGAFNEELVKAGILLAGEGLHPSSNAVRVKFSGEGTTVVDGPFAETKELLAGFWILELPSWDEVVAWVRRVPNVTGAESELEIRQIFSDEDFAYAGEEVVAKEKELRARTENRG
ncbi:YciI family protein [Actinosynnema pretiosum subsp. pretiosum]|uniref:YCII-related protein n=2 Tax=Actinosynnema TaxID=40566 RepID=C6WHQ2_ACTMD|nr:YciI family protein [Actinosynnema mirum]ACU40001.1 YCII-related protein [Actinosynnema mirum DSM 43827]AXX33524.1 PhnB protein [Actinosynnema pretiosum subsp. pretiosum]QUF02675.1 YciI family protein [Actinosynnema pretiosum subsp. pretiosum]